ncbi:glycosyltransferase [Tardibacter chloracetimidivorans]|uniref:glycosyltransferase n=1 Tax=Tardibacter chloracetimidivorans TaxID=1921510 RepID=UPI0013016EEE|nr:glycosyltransferase [Tardibacter chloracetimidivorans]
MAKSIEIATAAVEAGLPAQLWAVREDGPFRERVPGNVPVVQVGSSAAMPNRAIDLVQNIRFLGSEIGKRKPAVFLSGGNHMHLPAKFASLLSGHRQRMRLGLRASNSSVRTGGGRLAGLSRPTLTKLKYDNADFVVAVSKELATEIGQIGLGDVQCIPNGVDVARVRRMAAEPFVHPFLTEKNRSQPVLVAMGRIAHQKGFDVLIRSLAWLKVKYKAKLLVIGHGSAKNVDRLRALASKLNLSDSIDFLDYQANPFAIMSKADMFVSASRWEGASNALNEALICGLPIVATDCPAGVREALEGGKLGTLVPVDDPRALARGIIAELEMDRGLALASAVNRLDISFSLSSWVDLLAREVRLADDQPK